MRLDIKAIGIGLVVFLLIGSIGYLILAFTYDSRISLVPLMLPYVGAGIGGGLTAHFARQDRICHAALLSLPMAVGFGLLNYVWSAAGLPADFYGLKGSVWAGILSLPTSLFLCAGGALIVIWKQRYTNP